ncbi:uncharacterized protein LOC133324992 [Musca vetustissima]|uniref:uncharacterized protein LOC133322261 n=1 Tax=Musca vetustissima TaxID=27455 RepID=UPI002AB78913|nr:uncharacterized protein LOC133322261 [Musca vetustissima]XP_061389803.1 uncharacterized protein LOC133324992 [Musca vetustissima]
MAEDPINQQQFAEDVLAATQDDGSFAAGGNLGDLNGNMGKLPSVDEVWKLIEQMDGISDEERASIRENLYNPQEGTAEDFMKRYAQPDMGHTSWDYIIFFTMLAIIIAIFALFGYKLYKSLMSKELKKQEKLKQKQSKKSKKVN